MHAALKVLSLSLALALAACATGPKPDPKIAFADAPFEVIVFGDTPYTAADEAMLARALPVVKAVNPSFVLHVGDFQSGGDVCGSHDTRFQSLVNALAPLPVIYTPGDNEWTDCDRQIDPATGKPFSELKRLDTLRHLFFGREVTVPATMIYKRARSLPENARLDYAGVIVVTVNVSGTNNGRDAVMGDDLHKAARAADQRDKANVRWLNAAFDRAKKLKAKSVIVVMQADITHPLTEPPCRDAVSKRTDNQCDGFYFVRQSLIANAQSFGKPVLLIHGDTDPFTLTHGDFGVANLWRLNAAGDAGINATTQQPYGVVDVTHLTIDLSKPMPFKASGLLTQTQPNSK
ncbi:metallophosphoesterase family protein [Asticcacaulis machinosus]|uniref:Metallophosphoesterase family protein n=1 Tax=Asticcacaulis machinosus TaxID=2984211 RepID=A0ABT5HNI9_9CAUL|nr:metallophosphoesterase family protein [Asticcacaulis machinosus]MDC7677811.1 metallophosphoesterase family protein [Asticcacaulis machinosus]